MGLYDTWFGSSAPEKPADGTHAHATTTGGAHDKGHDGHGHGKGHGKGHHDAPGHDHHGHKSGGAGSMQIAQLHRAIQEQQKAQEELRKQFQEAQAVVTEKESKERKERNVNLPYHHNEQRVELDGTKWTPGVAQRPPDAYVDPDVTLYVQSMNPMLPSPAVDKSALYEHIKSKTDEMPESKYVVMKNGYKFRDVHQVYRMEDDVWERTLNMRSLDEAVTGDVNMSMPPPVVFPEDYDNYREGKYIRDDCWMA